MSDRLDELGRDTEVVLITFTDHENLVRYSQRHHLPFPILIDPDRASYRAYGLGRGSVARVWGIAAARRYLEIFRTRGVGDLRKPIEDSLQLGGDFVIDPEGVLVYGHWAVGPDDRPTVDQLIDAVQSSRKP